MSFHQVHDYKYLEVNINNKNCMHNKIKLRLKGCYFAISRLFKTTKVLIKNSKQSNLLHTLDQLYRTRIIPGLKNQETSSHAYKLFLREKCYRGSIDLYLFNSNTQV